MATRVVSFHYKLTDPSGKVLDSSEGKEAFSYMEGAHQIIPGLESQMGVLKKGDKKRIEVAAAQAYGLRDEKMIVTISKKQLPATEVKVGDRFRGGQEGHANTFTVTRVGADDVTLDGNHPLAGQDLVFDVELTDVRDATSEEIAHGHAHGPHGHSH